MMCDECGVRPANIHLTTFVNGEKQMSRQYMDETSILKFHKGE